MSLETVTFPGEGHVQGPVLGLAAICWAGRGGQQGQRPAQPTLGPKAVQGAERDPPPSTDPEVTQTRELSVGRPWRHGMEPGEGPGGS